MRITQGIRAVARSPSVRKAVTEASLIAAGYSSAGTDTGETFAPTLAQCLYGRTGEWPEGKAYAAWQRAKLHKFRLGLAEGSPLAAEVDAELALEKEMQE